MLEPKYKNFPEVKENIFSGEGVKKMKAYKSTLKIDELNALRDEFFASRMQTQGPIWKQIRHASLLDCERAQQMIVVLNLTPMNGCMNLLVDPNGYYFAVPNFCINDPYLEKIFVDADEERETKRLKVSYNYNNKD